MMSWSDLGLIRSFDNINSFIVVPEFDLKVLLVVYARH